MGRGTTPIQSALMGRQAAGSDINPLSLLLTRPRINPPKIEEIKFRLDSLDLAGKTAAELREDLLPFSYKNFKSNLLFKTISFRDNADYWKGRSN